MSLTLEVNNGSNIPLEFWTFPGGERNVRIADFIKGEVRSAQITCHYKSSDDLVDLILLTNTLRNLYGTIPISLNIPYFPFARQDRCMTLGEPNALQAVVQVINMLDFYRIYCLDPHSDVLPALFPAGKLWFKQQHTLWYHQLKHYPVNSKSALVSPDAGAAKKIYKLANILEISVIEASKVRDPKSGKITSTKVSFDPTLYNKLFIVDDICDGGRTFVELAKAIRANGYTGKLILCVTHGIFSQGLEPLKCFDEIFTINNMSTCDLSAFNN